MNIWWQVGWVLSIVDAANIDEGRGFFEKSKACERSFEQQLGHLHAERVGSAAEDLTEAE